MTATDDKSIANATSSESRLAGNRMNSLNNAQYGGEENLIVHRDDDEDTSSKSAKRSSIATNSETQRDQNPRLQRPRRNSKTSSSTSTATSNTDVVVSSLAKRLTEMAVEERQDAMYDLHGLPRDDERPETIKKLLNEMDKSIEERLQFSKSSYADGDNFGEPDLFARLTPKQQHELMLVPKETPTMEENNLDGDLMEDADNSQTPTIQQRIQFLKHYLDDKDFGEGLRLARAQNPEYVHAQRIKFLRADRYDVKLASARMIRFFDMKRELFCDPKYNTSNTGDTYECLSRDLRLSDFSKEDLELWRKTGFFQLCGMRDRAKRPIALMFGKVIMEANVPEALILRAYLYTCNLWSLDEFTQRAGIVVIAYNMFTSGSPSKNPVSSTTDGNYAMESISDEDVIKQYLKKTYPLVTEVIKVGMAAQLRSVSMHFCIDHHILNSQFENIAGYMSTAAAARFRCHYASPKRPESSIFGTLSRNNESVSSVDKSHNSFGNDDRGAATDSQTSQGENGNEAPFDSTINPHQEVLYTLMTFGIPKDSIPINDITGEVQLDLHRAILSAIEEQENLDRSMEKAAASTISSTTIGAEKPEDSTNTANLGKISSSLSSSTASKKLWMSLTASTGSNSSFALFPNLLTEEDLEDGSDHSVTSLFGAPPPLDPAPDLNMDANLPDISSSFSSPHLGESISNDPEAPSENDSPEIIVPTANDVIMGRGPWNRNNAGNLRLKTMIERERDEYDCANRFERMRIVDGMLNELFDKFGSRFLHKAKTDEPAAKDVWLVAKRDKAHDKITHDFRNLRRQKNSSTKSSPGVNSRKPSK